MTHYTPKQISKAIGDGRTPPWRQPIKRIRFTRYTRWARKQPGYIRIEQL